MLWLPLDDWRMQRRAGRDDNHHLYAWTPLLLRNLLDEAGSELERVRVVAHAWAFGTRHRQLMAVALRPPARPGSAGGQAVLVEGQGLLGDPAP